MSREQEFLKTIASRNVIRVSVRAIVLSKGRVLVQKPTDDPGACYAFIGGGYEVGDTFVNRLRREFMEESNARIVDCQYLFVVENRDQVNGELWQAVAHYFAVTLDREDIESRESHLEQHWLPVSTLKAYDLRPWIVRDVIAEGRLHSVRHLIVSLDSGEQVTGTDVGG
jgi:ADP-ribose pyrophosphatase YjhB (NUDIX family)